MTLHKFLLAATLSLSSFTYMTPVLNAQTNEVDATINIIPDKTVKTEQGVRITVCVVGIPHTSQRIDGVELVMGSKIVKATDIDGVDFERYFQFEDEGVIMLEIDFPFQGTIPKSAILKFQTVNGVVTCPARN